MIRLFNGNRAGTLLLIPFFIGLYFLLNNYTKHFEVEPIVHLGYWGKVVLPVPMVGQIAAAVLIFINALILNFIFNSNGFLERNVYITALTYVILMSFFHSFYFIDGILIAQFFLLLVLRQIFFLSQNNDGRKSIFNASFLAGLAVTFYPPLLLSFPALLVMINILRPFVVKETLLAILGYSVPLIYAFVFLWVVENTVELKLFTQITNYSSKQIDFLITSILFTLLFILGIISNRLKNQKSGIRLKKLTSVLFWWLLAAIVLGLIDFVSYYQIERFSFLIMVLAIYLNYALNNKTFQFVANAMYYLTFTYSIVKFFVSF